MAIFKPKLDQTIFVYFNFTVSAQKVLMLGKESFCHDDAFNSSFLNEYRQPLRYDEYGAKWFTSLDDAKQALLTKNDVLVKIYHNYWEIREKEKNHGRISR